MLFSVLSLVLLKLSQFLYIRHSTYSQCSFSWFTMLVPQFFYFLQQTKLLLEIKIIFKISFIQSELKSISSSLLTLVINDSAHVLQTTKW